MGKYVWDICETENCNAHKGKGADYHYHGDPYGTRCLYSSASVENNHPSLYGFSLDGVPIYGRYTAESQDNQALPLDRCGGHTHGSYGYHYHSEVDTTGSFIKYMQGPSNCWRGDITKIPNFWDNSGRQANYDNAKSATRYVTAQRTDYELLKPCCGSTDFYVTGITKLNLIEGATTAVDLGSGSGPGPSGSGSGSASAPNQNNQNNSVSGSTMSMGSNSSNSVISYSFTTGNTNSYMCKQLGISVLNENLACAQADSGEVSNGHNILTCNNGGVIKCFAFASLGKTGGSCSGDKFSEDGNVGSDVAYLPADVAQSAIGKSSISFTLTQTTVNGIVSGFPSQGPIPKLKVLAMCSVATQAAGNTNSPKSASSGNLQNGAHRVLNIGFFNFVLILMMLSFVLF